MNMPVLNAQVWLTTFSSVVYERIKDVANGDLTHEQFMNLTEVDAERAAKVAKELERSVNL